MWEPVKLSAEQIERCLNTVSPNTFHMIVADALLTGKPLSVVRMGDGEKKLFDCFDQGGTINEWFPEEWRVRIGVEGIDSDLLYARMKAAINDCDYFSPSISGIITPIYDLYYLRKEKQYVDNFFVNYWSEEQIVKLYRQAKHVVILHRNEGTRFAFSRRAKDYLDVRVTGFELSNWSQADNIIELVSALDAPLVLFSGGPGAKYIGPDIARSGKVVLDIGNTVDKFILWETEQQQKKS